MGIITQLVLGTLTGIGFVYTLDDYYYKVLRRTTYLPVKEQFKDDEVDIIKVFEVGSKGLYKAYKELYWW